MKISQQTIEILKNFAKINPNFIVDEPSQLIRTSIVGNSTVALASVPETLPKFAVYDLNEFLSLAAAFTDPEFDFGDTSVQISSGRSKFRYAYCSERLIEVKAPKNLKTPDPSVVIEKLEKASMKTLLQAASSLSVEKIHFKSVDGKIVAEAVSDKNGGSSNTFSIELADSPAGKSFELIMDVSDFRFIVADYKVEFFGKKAVLFSSNLGQDHSIKYLVSLNSASTMEG